MIGGIFSGWVSRIEAQGRVVYCIGVWALGITLFGLTVGFADLAVDKRTTMLMLGLAVFFMMVAGAADVASAAIRMSILQSAADDNACAAGCRGSSGRRRGARVATCLRRGGRGRHRDRDHRRWPASTCSGSRCVRYSSSFLAYRVSRPRPPSTNSRSSPASSSGWSIGTSVEESLTISSRASG